MRRILLTLAALGLGLGTAQANPAILHQPPLEAREGQPLEITAVVTDPASGVVQVRLFYRTSGTLAYQFQIMNGSGYNYAAQIPGSAVLASGVDYYIEAVSQAGISETSPAVSAGIAPYHVSALRAASGPELELLSPGDKAVVSPEEAVVVVAIRSKKSRPDLTTVTVLFDEQDVTRQARISETLIAYVPTELAEGLHGLKVSLRTLEGQTSESPTWSFRVAKTRPSPAGDEKPVAEAGVEPSLRLTGTLAAETQYAALSQKPEYATYLAQPEGFLNQLSLNLAGQVSGFQLAGSAYVTSEEKPGRQPVNRFKLEASSRDLLFSAGDLYPAFSPLTLNDVLVRGGRVHLTSGTPGEAYSQLQVVGGMSRMPVEGRYLQPGTFEQWLWGVRFVHDFVPGTGFAFNYDTVNDFAQSIREAGNALPADNHAASGEAHLKLPFTRELSTTLYAEYGGSFYDSEHNLASYSLGDALRGGMRWEWSGRSHVQVEYRRIGANYVSLANPWLIGDWEGFSASGMIFALNDDLALTGSLDTWRDNLDNQKNLEYVDTAGTTVTAGTTRTIFWSGGVNYRLAPYLSSIHVTYSMNRQQDDAQPAAVIDHQTAVLAGGAGGQWPLAGEHQLTLHASYSRTEFQDLARRKLSPGMISGTWMTTAGLNLGRAWTVSAGLGQTRNQIDSASVTTSTFLPPGQTIDYLLAHLRAAWKIAPGVWDVNAGWETTAGRDDQSLVENSLARILAGANYVPAAGHTLAGTISQIQYRDQIAAVNSYQEWVFNLRYSVQF